MPPLVEIRALRVESRLHAKPSNEVVQHLAGNPVAKPEADRFQELIGTVQEAGELCQNNGRVFFWEGQVNSGLFKPLTRGAILNRTSRERTDGTLENWQC